MLLSILRQALMHALIPLLGKIAYLALLWISKKGLKCLKWLSRKTQTPLDNEFVELMERALKLQEQEPVPTIQEPKSETDVPTEGL